jgi:hypothetical protein
VNASASVIVVPEINGTRMDLGWLAGRLLIAGQLAAVIVPPKADRAYPPSPLCEVLDFNKDALSRVDGYANTVAWAKLGSRVAQYALDHGLIIGAQDQVELVYRTFKPTTRTVNQFYSGCNPSSVPPGYPYTVEDTLQTTVEEFKEGGPEAFTPDYKWTSTQIRVWAGNAVVQAFSGGYQGFYHKSDSLEPVLLRSVIIH